MNHKMKIQKIYTQHSLAWSLKVGGHMGTLTSNQAARLANVKPVVFHRWIFGKLAAPMSKLEKIKKCAFGEFNRCHRKIKYYSQSQMADIDVIKARFIWKGMIFDQLRMTAKRRFCAKQMRIQRKSRFCPPLS